MGKEFEKGNRKKFGRTGNFVTGLVRTTFTLSLLFVLDVPNFELEERIHARHSSFKPPMICFDTKFAIFLPTTLTEPVESMTFLNVCQLICVY